MTLTCTKCRRANPQDAVYCYFDGTLLPGQARGGGPVNAGARPFSREFVFPSGRRCRNFDELCLACVQDRPAAVQLLEAGHIESFLTGIGRADLAAVARQAARFPDRERGLDMLLEKLPSQVVDPPRLQVEPLALNLGQLQVGQNHRFGLQITNHGMRLLYGTAMVEDTPWLALGEEPGVPEKSFDCDHDVEIPVLVRGQKLKAAKAAQEGRIVVESNGGTAEVLIRLEVPIKPFPSGLLAGAMSQRQLAEMAFKQPREAAPLFESGAVRQWYAANGWTYPVQGPTASGLGALQQFLEACGLTQPPKVEIDAQQLVFQGAYGERLEQTLKVRALEKKPAYAYAFSDQEWLIPQPAHLSGTQATIPVQVPSVPFAVDGGTMSAKLTVVANGRQRFVIPVYLKVLQGFAASAAAPLPLPPPTPREEPIQLFDDREPDPVAPAAPRDRNTVWLHTLPAALLMTLLLVLVLVDWVRPRHTDVPAELDGDAAAVEHTDDNPYLKVNFSDESFHRFGITLPATGPGPEKKLTFDVNGRSNNTCIRIDGAEFLFGISGAPGREQRNIRRSDEYLPGRGWRSTFDYRDDGIRVIQDVSLRRSDQTGRNETCLVRYTIKNVGAGTHTVGLRFMLDTFIGENDGVPFTIPGREGLCNTQHEFKTPEEVPDFIQALERADLKNPGTVAHLTLKLQDREGKLDPPSRVQLGAWPNHNLGLDGARDAMTYWTVPLAPMNTLQPHDSAVIIYWDDKPLKPGETREMGFAYGLGRVSSTGQGAGKLAITVDGAFRPGGEFTVTAYVSQPEHNQSAVLLLPEGLRLADGEQAERTIRPSSVGALSPVTWRVRAERVGDYELKVQTGGITQGHKVRIKTRSFLD